MSSCQILRYSAYHVCFIRKYVIWQMPRSYKGLFRQDITYGVILSVRNVLD